MEQGIPPQEEAQAPEGGEGGGQIADLLGNVGQGLAMLSEVITDSGIDPALAEEIQALQAGFDGVVEKIASGGAAAQPQGQAPMEAGAAGVPQTPAMR